MISHNSVSCFETFVMSGRLLKSSKFLHVLDRSRLGLCSQTSTCTTSCKWGCQCLVLNAYPVLWVGGFILFMLKIDNAPFPCPKLPWQISIHHPPLTQLHHQTNSLVKLICYPQHNLLWSRFDVQLGDLPGKGWATFTFCHKNMELTLELLQ